MSGQRCLSLKLLQVVKKVYKFPRCIDKQSGCFILYLKRVTIIFVLFQDIPLSEVLSVETNIDPLATDATREPHCFEMKTRTNVYYVGQVDNLQNPDPVDRDAGIGTRLGSAWAEAIKCALNPGCVTPQTSSMAGPKSAGRYLHTASEIVS
jgi:hypothetical protein